MNKIIGYVFIANILTMLFILHFGIPLYLIGGYFLFELFLIDLMFSFIIAIEIAKRKENGID